MNRSGREGGSPPLYQEDNARGQEPSKMCGGPLRDSRQGMGGAALEAVGTSEPLCFSVFLKSAFLVASALGTKSPRLALFSTFANVHKIRELLAPSVLVC